MLNGQFLPVGCGRNRCFRAKQRHYLGGPFEAIHLVFVVAGYKLRRSGNSAVNGALRFRCLVIFDFPQVLLAFECVRGVQPLRNLKAQPKAEPRLLDRNGCGEIRSWSMGLLCCSAAFGTCRSGRTQVFGEDPAAVGV